MLWSLCPASAGWPQPCHHQCRAECRGSRCQPTSRCRDRGAGSSLGLWDPRRVWGVQVQALPELLQCPPASHHIPAGLGREGLLPQGYPGSTGLGGRLPPHGASCSRRWPWAAGAKAQMPPHRLPRRCHLRARGCQAGGATTPPGHPTPASGHCSMAGCRDPQNGVLRALRGRGGRGEGSGRKEEGEAWLPACLPPSVRSRGHCPPSGPSGRPVRPPRQTLYPQAWGCPSRGTV